jgi:hypothetical protein
VSRAKSRTPAFDFDATKQELVDVDQIFKIWSASLSFDPRQSLSSRMKAVSLQKGESHATDFGGIQRRICDPCAIHL